MSVYVIDELMGRGKTSAMINYVNSAGKDTRYLFIVPYLGEVARIRSACAEKGFVDPLEAGGKLNNIKRLLDKGGNIVSTHALFSRFDEEVLAMVRDAEYTLVMDEVTSVIENVDITAPDSDVILQNFAESDADGLLRWTDEEYQGKLQPYRELSDKRRIYQYGSGVWLGLVPEEMFTSFKNVYLMTYLFEHQVQRCYFDFQSIGYSYLYVNGSSPDTYSISDKYERRPPIDIRSLIDIVDSPRLNAIGDERTALSKNWYQKNYYGGKMRAMKNNTYNFFHNYAKTPAEQNLWTVFCEDQKTGMNWRDKLKGNGYASGFLACNTKGSNDYRHKTSLAYLVNRFPNSRQRNFLHKHGIPLDSDMFALSEMVQWIWRSAIRDGKPVTIYVPSRRMRELLRDWIREVSGA